MLFDFAQANSEKQRQTAVTVNSKTRAVTAVCLRTKPNSLCYITEDGPGAKHEKQVGMRRCRHAGFFSGMHGRFAHFNPWALK